MTSKDELREHKESDVLAMMAAIQKYWVTASGEPELREFAEYILNLLEGEKQIHKDNYMWLLGIVGDFPMSEPGKRYNWRSKLRERIPKEMLYEINQATLNKEPNKGEDVDERT